MARNSLYKDLTGVKFGALKVLRRDEGKTDSSKSCYWLCECDCGNIVSRKTSTLNRVKYGAIPNCGCVDKKRLNNYSQSMKKHGMTNTKIFRTWGNMLDRCGNPRSNEYYLYGERGICVCEEWKSDFLNFYNWAISNGYKEGLSIDRIDVNGNYCPENCRWVTIKDQIRNRRNTVYVILNGDKVPLGEVAEKYNIDYGKLYKRIKYKKMNIEDAIFELGGNKNAYKENS